MNDLLLERADGVATITLNRPDRMNAVPFPMWGDLRKALQEVAERAEDRVLVVTGAGKAFCAGADLAGVTGDRPYLPMMRLVSDAANRLHLMPKPTIAKVNGAAVGAGCNLALGCDLIVASEEARFSQIFAQRGLSVDFGGSYLLPRLVGLHKAKELALFGDILTAAEADQMGLVNRVVPAADLDKVVDEWAARLAQGPTLALSATKILLNQSLETSFEKAVESEALAQSINFVSEDTKEAMLAFKEKRPARFVGG